VPHFAHFAISGVFCRHLCCRHFYLNLKSGSKILRVDDLAFTVLYYDSDPLLGCSSSSGGGGDVMETSVPQRWNTLTTAPLQLSTSLARGDDGTDQVTENSKSKQTHIQ
jgi:hypothetical protein